MNYFEKYLREKLINSEAPLDTLSLWEAIEQKRKKRRRAMFFYWTFGVVMSVALLGLGVMSWKKSANIVDESTTKITKNQAQNQVTNTFDNIAEKQVQSQAGTGNERGNNITNTEENEKQIISRFNRNEATNQFEKIALNKVNPQDAAKKTAQNTGSNLLDKKAPLLDDKIADVSDLITETSMNNKSNVNILRKNEVSNALNNEATETTNLIEQKLQIVENQIIKNEKIDFLPFFPTKEIVFNVSKNNVLEAVNFKQIRQFKKPKHELSLAFGAGLANRKVLKKSDIDTKVGNTKNIIVYASDLKYNYHVKKNYYISVGVQANQYVNLLTYDNTKNEIILQEDSLKKLVYNQVTGQVNIVNDTLRIKRETKRQVLQYQYFTNLNLTFGAGKTWTRNRFGYQVGADFGISILQKQKAKYLDNNLVLQPLAASKKIQSNVQVYAQVAYRYNKNTSVFSRISYWQPLSSLDNIAKYNTFLMNFGVSKRF